MQANRVASLKVDPGSTAVPMAWLKSSQYSTVPLGFVAGEVGKGLDVSGMDFAHNHRAPRGVVRAELPLERGGRHVLQVQVQRGHHVQALDRIHEVVVRDGHPLVAGHFARELLAFDAGEFFVPGALDANALLLTVDAHRSCGELAEGATAVFTTLKHQAALVTAQLHEGEFAQFLVGGERDVSGDEGLRCPRCLALSNLRRMPALDLSVALPSNWHRVSTVLW